MIGYGNSAQKGRTGLGTQGPLDRHLREGEKGLTRVAGKPKEGPEGKREGEDMGTSTSRVGMAGLIHPGVLAPGPRRTLRRPSAFTFGEGNDSPSKIGYKGKRVEVGQCLL